MTPTSLRIRSTSILCSARSFRSEIISSLNNSSSARDAPLGRVPLIGAVVMMSSFVDSKDSGEAHISANSSSLTCTKPEYGAGFDETEWHSTSHGSDSIAPSQVLP